ncbi:unnamed protein product [Rhizophagus irregularis]|nr:unnamed protein product [Rhizophagus irregularis]
MHRLMSWFIMTLQLYLPIAISLSSLHVSFENYTNYTSSPLHIIKGDTQLIPDDPRPIIENQLKKILQPPKKSVVLYIICAEFGTEKALSIKKIGGTDGKLMIPVWNPSWSQGTNPPMEIGNISEEERINEISN